MQFVASIARDTVNAPVAAAAAAGTDGGAAVAAAAAVTRRRLVAAACTLRMVIRAGTLIQVGEWRVQGGGRPRGTGDDGVRGVRVTVAA